MTVDPAAVTSSGQRQAAPAVLSVREISKAYGAVVALRGATFSCRQGEVHALIGENGAGKSTLVKILSGVTQPDAGEITIQGARQVLATPGAALRLGIAAAFQELTLIPDLSVAENLLLRRAPRRAIGTIDRPALRRQAEHLLEETQTPGLDPEAIVADLTLADRQRVEILKALAHRPHILLLDEATSALQADHVAWLFRLLRDVAARLTTVVFISHRLYEIQAIADRLTVFRNGQDVATFTPSDVGDDELIATMTGRRFDTIFPPRHPAPATQAVLQVHGLRGPGLHGIDFELRRGEILGIAGLQGQGQRELFTTLFGLQHPSGGAVLIAGRPAHIRHPRDAIEAGLGLGLVPEDRKTEGLLVPLSLRDNISLPILRRLSVLTYVRPHRERAAIAPVLQRLGVKASHLQAPVSSLSGGNQQKVVLARWLVAGARILLLYDPTRGVDVGTKHDIYELIVALAARGVSILFYSTETDETVHLSHRVLVMREGRVARTLSGDEITGEQIVRHSLRLAEGTA